ncbi:hypothetical protein [Noviherbaspirillum saxi]|uniref:AhpC/TSA family protein n=1 Tax=Noviherbaspirillum saxi TaxID=2320863 RepID=A0A3A3FRZ8_9BURK|nr:hypothetical protein [Noviherbaspirillum saxi]RJF98034.1 hypothetical protein D3871_05530 [Noviherbaspirillum saxi]
MAIKARNLVASLLLATTAAAAHAATIQAFEPDTLERIVAQQKGKAFVFVVWSLDCEYCQASLKTLSQEKRKRKDLQVVTLATDPVADPQAVALMKKKLESVGMSANAWAYGNAPPEQLRYALDQKWHGEKPRSYWFNARGERVAYSGVITAETIAKMTAR